jgi:superfamily II DNA helicase RecQ
MAPERAAGQVKFKVVRYDVLPGDETTSELPHLAAIVEVVDRHLLRVGKPWNIKLWQAAVAAEIPAGRNVIVKAQTGYGKSMCYQALAIMHPDDCILVICPLLALMADQVKSTRSLDINAVQLSAAGMREDPELLNKVREGQFSMVLVAAEFTASEAWKSLISDRTGRQSNFAQSLRRIIIDEAHLVREWSVMIVVLFTG